MKVLFLSLAASLAMQALTSAGIETEISEANRAILPSGDPADWKPSAAEIQKALISIEAFLENPNLGDDWKNGEVKKIQAHTKEYRMQVIGIVRDGRKVIWCNFFPAPCEGGKDHFPEWQQHQVLVSDGGFWYWQIVVDPNSGECTKFSSNGEA